MNEYQSDERVFYPRPFFPHRPAFYGRPYFRPYFRPYPYYPYPSYNYYGQYPYYY